jgi:glycosyltransferase involved in cell wall biosynthesis
LWRGDMARPRICLSMIVKDETGVLARCLASVKPHIDTCVISDTGSTDGTQNLVRELMNDMPGELIERPWKDFAHNRNESLKIARTLADYVLVLDADDILVVEPNTAGPADLAVDGYYLRIAFGENRYDRIAMVRTDLPWQWRGVVHEVLVCDAATKPKLLKGWTLRCLPGGARSSVPGEKFKRDIELLERSRREDPHETRTVFYLAQSYRDDGQTEKAIATYRERVKMGGWDQEVFCAKLQIARLLEKLDRWPEALDAYLEAYDFRPTRAEPLCSIARHYRLANQFHSAALFAARAMALPRPKDVLFVEETVYTWRALDEYAVAVYWMNDYEAALAVNQRLLGSGDLPEDQHERVRKNADFCKAKLGERE